MTSFQSQIDAILTNNSGDASDELERKLAVYDINDVVAVVAKRAATGGGTGGEPFNGGTITEPLAVAVPAGVGGTTSVAVTAPDHPNAAIASKILSDGAVTFRLFSDGAGVCEVHLADDTHDGIAVLGTLVGLFLEPRSTLSAGASIVEVLDVVGNDSFVIRADGGVVLPTIPTSDPHVAGQLWANAGVVTVSAG